MDSRGASIIPVMVVLPLAGSRVRDNGPVCYCPLRRATREPAVHSPARKPTLTVSVRAQRGPGGRAAIR